MDGVNSWRNLSSDEATIIVMTTCNTINNDNDGIMITSGFKSKRNHVDTKHRVCSYESNLQYVFLGSVNGLVHNRRQVITWTNVDPIQLRTYAPPGIKVLRKQPCVK